MHSAIAGARKRAEQTFKRTVLLGPVQRKKPKIAKKTKNQAEGKGTKVTAISAGNPINIPIPHTTIWLPRTLPENHSASQVPQAVASRPPKTVIPPIH